MKAVDILGDEHEAVAQTLLDFGQSPVARVRFHRLRLIPPHRIEAPHELGITVEAFG